MYLSLIIFSSFIIITLFTILLLLIKKKEKNQFYKENEWDKIVDFGKKINEKTRKKK